MANKYKVKFNTVTLGWNSQTKSYTMTLLLEDKNGIDIEVKHEIPYGNGNDYLERIRDLIMLCFSEGAHHV